MYVVYVGGTLVNRMPKSVYHRQRAPMCRDTEWKVVDETTGEVVDSCPRMRRRRKTTV